jgi:hypothetical protein
MSNAVNDILVWPGAPRFEEAPVFFVPNRKGFTKARSRPGSPIMKRRCRRAVLSQTCLPPPRS